MNAGRTISVVQYSFFKAIHPYTVDRQGLLSKCTRIDGDMAKKLLNHGYKQLSKFKTWCPVEVRMCVTCIIIIINPLQPTQEHIRTTVLLHIYV